MRFFVFACLALCSLRTVVAEDKAIQTFVLREYLNHIWKRELVTYPLHAKTAVLNDSSPRLRMAMVSKW